MFPTLKGYDENGELAFKQGPFMDVMEALATFKRERDEAVHNKVFLLILEPEGQEARPRHRVHGVNFWEFSR